MSNCQISIKLVNNFYNQNNSIEYHSHLLSTFFDKNCSIFSHKSNNIKLNVISTTPSYNVTE